MTDTAHTVTVEYTNSDDGIWVVCSCGWRGQVPDHEFCPTPEQLVILADRHRPLKPVLPHHDACFCDEAAKMELVIEHCPYPRRGQ